MTKLTLAFLGALVLSALTAHAATQELVCGTPEQGGNVRIHLADLPTGGARAEVRVVVDRVTYVAKVLKDSYEEFLNRESPILLQDVRVSGHPDVVTHFFTKAAMLKIHPNRTSAMLAERGNGHLLSCE